MRSRLLHSITLSLAAAGAAVLAGCVAYPDGTVAFLPPPVVAVPVVAPGPVVVGGPVYVGAYRPYAYGYRPYYAPRPVYGWGGGWRGPYWGGGYGGGYYRGGGYCR